MAKRQYQNDFPSVTTIISQLTNYGLMEWFKRTPYAQIIEESNRGKKVGTEIQVIQDYIEKGSAKIETVDVEEVSNALNSFILFKKENPHIILKRSEVEKTSDDYFFNGTIDALAEVNSEVVLLDWKSGKCGKNDKPPIYDSYKTQCAAYCHLMGLTKAIIVSVAKDAIAYDTYEMTKEEIHGEFNEVFLPLLTIWNYKNQKKGIENGINGHGERTEA